MTTFALRNRWALGDTVCLSALVRDIALNYSGKHRVMMTGHYVSFWNNNPHVVPYDAKVPHTLVTPVYQDGIRAAGRGHKIHFLSWFHKDFEKQTGIPVPVIRPKGDIHLESKEKQPIVTGRYWLVVAGGKLDMTAKLWSRDRWQEVVDALGKKGIRCVQAGSTAADHVHEPLDNALNLIGRTEHMRDFLRLVYHAEGVICGITAAMHTAAVWDKPCVVLAGGREERHWEEYAGSETFGPKCGPVKVPHRFLHAIGKLDCCKDKGCWKKRTVPIEQDDYVKASSIRQLCKLPVKVGSQSIPKCLEMISVPDVVDAVMSYYKDGTLPPLDGAAPQPPVAAAVAAPLPLLIRLPGAFNDVPPAPSPAAPTSPELKLTASLPVPKPSAPIPAAFPKPPGRTDFSILDNPLIGGKLTVFVLSYGPHTDLTVRCVDSILHSLAPERLDLRVGTNAVVPGTLDYLRSIPKEILTKLYVSEENILKGPMMRRMFHDQEHPVKTKYLAWFDDDSFVVDPLWAVRLGETIVANHAEGSRLYGIKFFHDLMLYAKNGHRPDGWFRGATWFRGIDFYAKGQQYTSPNGSAIYFVSGGFMALETRTMQLADIPDARLGNKGIDITVGAQVSQVGGKIKDFNRNKIFIHSSGAPRRGVVDPFPWSMP